MPVDLGLLHAQDGPIQENIFPAGKFGVETGSYFQKAGHTAPDPDTPRGRLRDLAEYFQ
ncbi:hypothetical protein D9M68_1006370 [compost metagenome]